MSSSRPTFALGSFVVGEVPPPLTYQFLDADGAAIDLTGFTTVRFNWALYVHGQYVDPVSETGSVTDAVTGTVTYVWDGDEFATAGDHVATFYVNDGTTQYASVLLTWQVCLPVGTPPVP